MGAATARLLRSTGHRVVVSGRHPEPLRRLAEDTGAFALSAQTWDLVLRTNLTGPFLLLLAALPHLLAARGSVAA
ncbi:hypothetical protein [Streptomyces sp. ODS05-4]|uniref:hypothetical protein n=1 Tax=Streptomyces sp. ODS05-4 TaxID=2944939 RepID=UPI0027E4B0A1|nr:hypothetical protein [Streptomyces sp. ODS05-4]